jgi:methylenetetrahydrofolate dehydrogenase (NADP+)/methenyltetrahydrofolate cyclohydrolase
MTARIIDGKAIAEEVRAEVARDVEAHVTSGGPRPHLSVVLVGDDPASAIYVRSKGRAASEAGITSDEIILPEATSEAELIERLEALNADPAVHGILVQMPLPQQISADRVLDTVSPEKDVDGLTPASLGRLLGGRPRFVPATPSGIQQMLLRSDIDPAGRRVVIVGRSILVGRPLAALLSMKAEGANATVTMAHTGTQDLPAVTREAEILVVAAGRANTITVDMVQPGATVIDVGTNRIDAPERKSGSRLVGDVDFEAVREVAGAITPVPGGVGPMTIAMLLVNTLQAAR